MKTTINFECNSWYTECDENEYSGTFEYRVQTKSIQIDWYEDKPSNWEEIENDIYLEVIANF